MDDRTLIKMIRKGDAHAFRILVKRHQGPLYNFFLRSGCSIEDSEDLTQQLFVKLLEGAYEIREGATFRTYLYRMATNLLIDHLRKIRRVDFVDFGDPAGEERIRPIGSGTPLPDENAETAQLRERYDRALEALPDSWRTVLELRVTAEMTYAQIAESTGLTVPAVESVLFRARERLAGLLKDFRPERRHDE